MDAVAHLIDTAAQFMRQRAKNGILLRKERGGQVCSLLHTLEETKREESGGVFLLGSDQTQRLQIKSSAHIISPGSEINSNSRLQPDKQRLPKHTGLKYSIRRHIQI